jgi:hypothetical protein
MKILAVLKHELFEVLPPTIFFLIAFTLILATQRLILREYGIPLTGFGMAVVGALLVGKVVLIVDKLPFVNKFPDKPLIYNTLWKTFIYMSAALLVRYIEHIAPLTARYGDFAEANRRLVAEIVWPHFVMIHMWLVVLFFVYCAMRELVRVIGREKVRHLFVGGKPPMERPLDLA